jgi:hypothetical protein
MRGGHEQAKRLPWLVSEPEDLTLDETIADGEHVVAEGRCALP